MEQKPNRIIVHHSAVAGDRPQFLDINAYHESRGFPKSSLGYFGGYHYLIEKTGLVFHYRNETETGAHDSNENLHSFGICLSGNFNAELPTAGQETALASLLDGIMARWNIQIDRIDPHRWGDTTDCPGKRLSDMWARAVYVQKKINWLKYLILWLQKRTP